MMHRLVGWLGLATLVLGCSWAAAAPAGDEYDGITKPSEQRELNFSAPGVVLQVLVKEGDAVKQGQVLVQEDDRMEKTALDVILVEANSVLKIEAAKLDLEQKKVALKRITDMRQNNVASQSELEQAQLDVQLGEKRVLLAEEEQTGKKLEARRQQIKIDLMSLRSTIDGLVKQVGIKEGELADPNNPNKPAVVVVKNDPLWVEVHLPTALVGKLKQGETLRVKYPDQKQWMDATIRFFDPVADAGSGTRLVRLELPNPSGREAGWQVQVQVKVPAEK